MESLSFKYICSSKKRKGCSTSQMSLQHFFIYDVHVHENMKQDPPHHKCVCMIHYHHGCSESLASILTLWVEACQHAHFLMSRTLLTSTSFGLRLSSSSSLCCDYENAISLAKDYVKHSKSKHVVVHYHYVRHEVYKGTIMIEYCPTHRMIACILTKGLGETRVSL